MTERSRGDPTPCPHFRNRRAALASEVAQLERQIRQRKEALGHVDATLRLLDPSVDVDAIPNKRIVKRIKLFRQEQLGRMIVGVLREAHAPIGTHAIVAAILRAGGYGPGARSALMPRVRGNLAYLHRRQKVIKSGSGKSTRWTLAYEQIVR
jgi:hypothetical protein